MMGDAYRQGSARSRSSAADVTIDEIDAKRLRACSRSRSGSACSKIRTAASARTSRRPSQRPRVGPRGCAQIDGAVKNDGVLPMREPARIALIGPMCDAPADQLGAWASAGAAEEFDHDPRRRARGLSRGRSLVCRRLRTEGADRRRARGSAQRLRRRRMSCCCAWARSASHTGEACSRTRPELPQTQIDLARDSLCAAASRVVLALVVSRPLVLPDWLVEGASAILITWHAGSETGPAFADLVSGAVSPSGKLCVSWPATLGQMPVFYGMRPTGRPHDPANGWSTGFLDAPYAPRWSFGEGLGYARFTRANLRADSAAISGDGAVTVSLDVRNDGDMASAETLFLFIRDPVARVTRPVLELKDFYARRTRARRKQGRSLRAARHATFRIATKTSSRAWTTGSSKSTSAQARRRAISTASTCGSKTAPLRSAKLTGA